MSNTTKYRHKLLHDIKTFKKEDRQLHRDIVKNVLSDHEYFLKKIDNECQKVLEQISNLYYYGFLTDNDKHDILDKLGLLHSYLSNYNSRNNDNLSNIDVILAQIESWLEHESNYIDYKPGAQNKSYIRISELIRSKYHKLIVDKAELVLKGNELFYDGKLIQGIKLQAGFFTDSITITGDHYSHEEGIRKIYQHRHISSSSSNPFSGGNDPYCYLSEVGKLQNHDSSSIRRILGAASADSFISVKVTASSSHVWIRVKRGAPAKFAIESKNLPIKSPKPQRGFKVCIGNKVTEWAA